MDPFSQIQLTEEEFYSFHNIDRQLFFRLVFILRREPYEAMQAVAFWIWLERLLHKSNCVSTILNYPDHVIETVFQETLMVLRVVESDQFHALDNVNDIPILQSLLVGNNTTNNNTTPTTTNNNNNNSNNTNNQRVTNLSYFHERRISVILGVGTIVQQICLRAFQDLMKIITININNGLPSYYYNPIAAATNNNNFSFRNNNMNFNTNSGHDNVGPLGQSFMVGDFSVPLKDQSHFPSLNPSINLRDGSSSSNNTNIPTNYYPPELHVDYLGDILACMDLGDAHQPTQDAVIIPPRERTIFLTFSKGYPISEVELRDFLYRTFGDIIETLFMQDVSASEQPLYAKLVVRDGRAMHVVLGNEGKAKFSINGKHVWARKYIRKNNATSPPTSPN
ncbi:hypothetical protein vseg_005856 [Gypsophila vaccaria]